MHTTLVLPTSPDFSATPEKSARCQQSLPRISDTFWLAVALYGGLGLLALVTGATRPTGIGVPVLDWFGAHLVYGYPLMVPLFGMAYWLVVIMPGRWSRRVAAAVIAAVLAVGVTWMAGGGQAETQDALILSLPVLAGVIAARFMVEPLARGRATEPLARGRATEPLARGRATEPLARGAAEGPALGRCLGIRLLGFLLSIPAYFLVAAIFFGI